MNSVPKLSLSLLLLRLSVFYVMAIWVLDKFIKPEHTKAVFGKFYGVAEASDQVVLIAGIIQAIILIAFVIGLFKVVSYALVFLMHAVSTLSTWQSLINPFADGSVILFPTAVPMLAAIAVLWMLRKNDTLLSLNK